MSVTRADVEHIALLARLRLSEAELERLTDELNGILEHVDRLREAEPEAQEGGGGPAGPGPWREPEALEPDPLLRTPDAIAPDFRDGFFLVPRLPALDGGEEEGGGAP